MDYDCGSRNLTRKRFIRPCVHLPGVYRQIENKTLRWSGNFIFYSRVTIFYLQSALWHGIDVPSLRIVQLQVLKTKLHVTATRLSLKLDKVRYVAISYSAVKITWEQFAPVFEKHKQFVINTAQHSVG